MDNNYQAIANPSTTSQHPFKTINQQQTTRNTFAYMVQVFLWALFIGNVVFLAANFSDLPQWQWGNIIRINGFTLLIWTTVTFFSAVLSTYSSYYLVGFKYRKKFVALSLGFTISIMFFMVANHIGLLLFSWLALGVFMAQLIGVNAEWGEAKEASKFAQKYFLLGSLFLTAGVLILAVQTNNFTLEGITANISNISNFSVTIAALFIIVAAIIQSAIYPFHRWLLSAMTAPTPASALMHAGFVNGAGILLTLFSTVIFASQTFTILLIIGGLTAIIAQFTKLLQVNIKQKLGCSTIAQMGFMIMQCGLGFFNAAVVHLILHGFYKAYLFLSSGENVQHTKPEAQEKIVIKPLQAVVVLFFGIVGAFLFATLTGKGTAMDSGIFLTLIVAITVGQITYNIVKQKSLSLLQKAFLPPILFFIGIGLYALMYTGVTHIMASLPMVDVPLPLSGIQILFGVVFLIGFFLMKLGVYRKIPWLYVKLMNDSQPYNKTILMFKSK